LLIYGAKNTCHHEFVAVTSQIAGSEGTKGRLIDRVPPASFSLTSAIFHYLGPSLAVLLFAHVTALGVMWLRIATAGIVFAIWRRPWRILRGRERHDLAAIAILGLVLAMTNSAFYFAIARLPLATVGAIEFLGVVILASVGLRRLRNLAALFVTIGGVALLTVFKIGSDPVGFVFAVGNCAGLMAYVVLGHRIANPEQTEHTMARRNGFGGIDQLALAMIVAAIIATPIGAVDAAAAFVTRCGFCGERVSACVLRSFRT
jgi:inner membrane transporter RhtA